MFGREEKVSALRLTAVQYIIVLIFLVLAYGLWSLQVMQSGKYSQLAEQNRIRNVPILAPRGKILDREGRVIVDNYPSSRRCCCAIPRATSMRTRPPSPRGCT